MRLATLFSDHAVLQRGRPVPVWGWTTPGRVVNVTLGENVRAMTRADAQGHFRAWLPPQPAGGPFTLTAAAAGPGAEETPAVARDVLVGEVWLASGQSNMEMAVSATGDQPWNGGAAPNGVRMFTVPRMAGAGQTHDVPNGAWSVAGPAATPAFSAAAAHFAARLHRELNVPVGIVHASWGGTIVEAWTSRGALLENPDLNAWVQRYTEQTSRPAFWEKRLKEGLDVVDAAARRRFEQICPPVPENIGHPQGWADPDHDTADWPTMAIPGAWTRQGLRMNGVVWFRRAVDVPAGAAGRDLVLEIGAVDKQDITYWNGEEVGRTGEGFDEHYWNNPRRYVVPGRLVRAGANVVAVRAYSFAFDGGLIGPTLSATPADGARIELGGDWRYKIEHDQGMVVVPAADAADMGPGNPNSPHILFDNMIRPLLPYAMRGAIWYQGESNAGAAERYRRAMTAMARDWRRHFEQDPFPVIQVQLANYMQAADYDARATWPYLREAQLMATRDDAQVGLISAIDVGDAQDIHPRDKRSVGERLAGWALARTYRMPGAVAHGPHYTGITVEGDRIRAHFDGVGAGSGGRLCTRDGGSAVRTVYLADHTRRFTAAEAWLEGDTLVARVAGMSMPVAVRYGWSDNPASANLVNEAGLPASGFRSDTWMPDH